MATDTSLQQIPHKCIACIARVTTTIALAHRRTTVKSKRRKTEFITTNVRHSRPTISRAERATCTNDKGLRYNITHTFDDFFVIGLMTHGGVSLVAGAGASSTSGSSAAAAMAFSDTAASRF